MTNRVNQSGPSFNDWLDAFAEAGVCAASLLPFAFVVGTGFSLGEQGWLKFPLVWGILAALLALSFIWYHFSTRAKSPSVLAGIFMVSVVVTSLGADWVVTSPYQYKDGRPTTSYVPTRSPVWSRPTPESSVPGATDWEDACFFDPLDGKDMPRRGAARVEINWLAMTGRVIIYTILPFAAFCGINRLLPRRRTPSFLQQAGK